MYGDTCSLFDDVHLSDRFGWDGAGTVSETGCALFDDVHGLTDLVPGPTECGEDPPSDDQVGDGPELHCVSAAVVPVAANRRHRSYPGDQMAASVVPPIPMLRARNRPSARSPVPTTKAIGLPEVPSTSPPVAVKFRGAECRGHPQGQRRQCRATPHPRHQTVAETLNVVWAMSLPTSPQVVVPTPDRCGYRRQHAALLVGAFIARNLSTSFLNFGIGPQARGPENRDIFPRERDEVISGSMRPSGWFTGR